MESEQRSRLSTWFPIVQRVLPIGKYPATEIVYAPAGFEGGALNLLDGPDVVSPLTEERFSALRDLIEWKIAQLGGGPVFLRSDLMSGKHGSFGEKPPCFVDSASDVADAVVGIIEQHVMVNLGPVGLDRWAVRERLNAPSNVTAFRGLPIVPERRVMVDAEKGDTRNYPYWPAGALRRTMRVDGQEIDDEVFASVMDNVRYIGFRDSATLEDKSLEVADALWAEGHGSGWSVDWMQTDDRGWVLIDMAEASRSWMPEG